MDEYDQTLDADEQRIAPGQFVPNLVLSQQFFELAFRPTMIRNFPRMVYSAARIGFGDDVLGYDTEMWAHETWRPHINLCLNEEDIPIWGEIWSTLSDELPVAVASLAESLKPMTEAGLNLLRAHSFAPASHNIDIGTVPDLVKERIGSTSWPELGVADWLLASDERLLELTAGAVFHDGLDELLPMREKLSYYPDQIWRYMLASQWNRIANIEMVVGLTGDAGDELGSAMVTGTLVRDLMRLAFLVERTYAPYEMWIGSAFAKLKTAAHLAPILSGALAAQSSLERSSYLCNAYDHLANAHNTLSITDFVSPETQSYEHRNYQVLHAERFAEAIQATITDPAVLALPPYIGSIDQFSDSTTLLTHRERRNRLAGVYAGRQQDA